jgi:hypothetical protein
MGFEIKFNWALQITPPEKLKTDATYDFSKTGNRVYPINTPIDLINENREAISKVKIIEFTNKDGKTIGKYQIIKVYSGTEKEILSKYWKENK